jgi:oligopeptide/dipeptide ABC transporter ATP-binding protein
VQAVRGVSFEILPGSTLGIVGESGSGKSVMAMSMLGLIPPPGRLDGGTIRWRGARLVTEDDFARVRGRRMTMVFQDPIAGLNPLMPIGRQLGEVLRRHRGLSKRDAHQAAVELLAATGMPTPESRLKQYPYELSGGMAQRVMIAMALSAEPDLLIADEPTSALDVTIQAQILELLDHLQAERRLATVFITHDLGVVAGLCDRVAVMYGGRIVEIGDTMTVLSRPRHPYTAALRDSSPRIDRLGADIRPIPGSPPNLINLTSQCSFAPRCSYASDRCLVESPQLDSESPSAAACWHPLDGGAL